MAQRVAKTGGGGSREFTAGSQPLHITELDQDLDGIFTGIDDTNVATNANIQGSKLLAGSVNTAQLAAGSVTTAILANQPNGVTSGKLNINATGPALSSGQVAGNQAVQNTTTTLITLAPMTTRGGRVLLFGTVSGQWIITVVATTASWVLLRDGVVIAFGGSDSQWNQQSIQTTGSAAGTQLPGNFSVLFLDTTAGAGSHTYALQLTVVGAGGATFTTNLTRPGFLFALELA